MSVIGATADVICSRRVFRLLTHFGSRRPPNILCLTSDPNTLQDHTIRHEDGLARSGKPCSPHAAGMSAHDAMLIEIKSFGFSCSFPLTEITNES